MEFLPPQSILTGDFLLPTSGVNLDRERKRVEKEKGSGALFLRTKTTKPSAFPSSFLSDFSPPFLPSPGPQRSNNRVSSYLRVFLGVDGPGVVILAEMLAARKLEIGSGIPSFRATGQARQKGEAMSIPTHPPNPQGRHVPSGTTDPPDS